MLELNLAPRDKQHYDKTMKERSNTHIAILVVSFGTSYNNSRDITIGAVENAIAEAFPEYEVRRAFTSKIIIDNRILTPGTLVSSKELAILAGFPMHSVPGIPVLECAEFGRTVSTYDRSNPAENINIWKDYAIFPNGLSKMTQFLPFYI